MRMTIFGNVPAHEVVQLSHAVDETLEDAGELINFLTNYINESGGLGKDDYTKYKVLHETFKNSLRNLSRF